MADSINPNANNQIGVNFLPKFYQTISNKKFLQATIDQLLQPGTVKKVNGYIGRQNAKASTSADIFLESPTVTRQNYQLEPGLTIKDQNGDTVMFKDYQDFINQIDVFGGNTSNHSRINKQEFYSWDPHINWDKLVNFQDYYWLPYGPDPIVIRGHQEKITSELSVTLENEGDSNMYIFTPDGLTRNPVLTLYRNQTYKFNINSPQNPFSFKTSRSTGQVDRYNPPVISSTEIVKGKAVAGDGHGVINGVIEIYIPDDAPDILFYQSENDINLGGVIHVLGITENTRLNVTDEIIGKKSYVLPDGTALTNGMKVKFSGKVEPAQYVNGKFYVEGVGEGICLIDEKLMELPAPYTTNKEVMFDTIPFDSVPFGDISSYAGTPDYIVINRASKDRNYWSRYNRWVHQDVIKSSAIFNGSIPVLDQSARATRPIIEFDANLKLYNFGTNCVIDVDIVDIHTKDAFSNVEGSFGYMSDGIMLQDGHRVLFTADTDLYVKNKIYRVEMVDVLHETQTFSVKSVAFSTSAAGNLIEVDTTENLIIGQQITFSLPQVLDGSDPRKSIIGNIVPDKIYYISSVADSNHITISEFISGAAVIQIDAIGTMTLSSLHQTNSIQLHLVEEYSPVVNDVILIKDGKTRAGEMLWFTGNEWKLAQPKTTVNQPPLFDIFDENGISYGDISTYVASTFTGNKVFSYKVGTGTNDKKLGFPISYKNINNIGDIVFNFDLITEQFEYNLPKTETKSTEIGFLQKNDLKTTYVNGWKLNVVQDTQAAVRIYKDTDVVTNLNSMVVGRMYTVIETNGADLSDIAFLPNGKTFIYDGSTIPSNLVLVNNDYEIDMFNDQNNLNDLIIHAYVNGVWDPTDSVTVYDGVTHKIARITKADRILSTTDVITIRAFSAQPINDKGYYEIPINLQNNPLNESMGDFTLGEITDHVSSILQNISNTPYTGHLRDLGNVSEYGTKFVQHSGPFSLSGYHITTETNNIIRAIERSRADYVKFKKQFLAVAETLGIDTDPVRMVDLAMQTLNKDKKSSSPYYFSDMVPYGAKVINEYVITNYRNKKYPLQNQFDSSVLSNKAVGIYLNGEQLLHEHHYTFDDQGFVVISATLAADDVLAIYEYDSTDGCFVPETPTKLGLLPTYDPKIYLDTSYITPCTVIQGHDGSIVLAYGDYRDDMILELEKRIYNNIKVRYDSTIFNLNEIVPSYIRDTPYSLVEFNNVLAPSFFKWLRVIDRDFTKQLSYDRSNSMTYNYRGYLTPDGREVPGYWRGIYRWMLDTDRPNLCPWEMLGFNDMPPWWISVYGPAPYTSDNLVMWEDIANGMVKAPGKPLVVLEQYKRPFLINSIPVDENGNIKSPVATGMARGLSSYNTNDDFVFGDGSPIENTWRRSSHYQFSLILSAILLMPSKVFGPLLDRSRVKRNIAGQLVYTETNKMISPKDLVFPNTYESSTRVFSSGIMNYVVNYIIGDKFKSYAEYTYDLSRISCNLTHRVGAFTSKDKYNLLLDSKSPQSTGSIFVPPEDYEVILNSSNTIKKITYSGIIITRLYDGYEVKGYSTTHPYFKTYGWYGNGVNVNVGGISDAYVKWEARKTYAYGTIVVYDNKYYRVKSDVPVDNSLDYIRAYTSTDYFEPQHFDLLSKLPTVGGRDAVLRTFWDTSEEIIVPYGTKYETIQEVVDFIGGYGEYLKNQGFIFENVSNSNVSNWTTSIKQFLFWTTQNWSYGADIWKEWNADEAVPFNTIVRYNGDYYRANKNIPANSQFVMSDYTLLDGLSKVGSAVISLSPAASKITFQTTLSMVDDISDSFNEYEIVKVDGTPIPVNELTSYRDGNLISYATTENNTIYGASFYLIQKEHVVVLKNSTMFNDTIYSPVSGYKQDRIKVAGYISTNWDGSLNVPGFIIDQAKINDWSPWVDYALGDIVKHKQFYYSASSVAVGSATFDVNNWIKLDKKPESAMLPNWTYKATQFEDFYNLDSDNFDSKQQRVAQHLVGYQKRQYLENIIQDDVSEFKFYQGMILEKGTQNVLNKLFDVLSANNKESLTFYEEWAIRVGQYGASEGYDIIEFNLDEHLFNNNPQGFELVTNVDSTINDYIIRQGASDIYLAPTGYKSTPWEVKVDPVPYLRSAGYVRSDEVKLIVKSMSSIVDKTSADFDAGDYVWETFYNNSWNIYRYTRILNNVRSIGIDSQTMMVTINFDGIINIESGIYIGVQSLTSMPGIYKVNTANSTSISVIVDSNAIILSEDPATLNISPVVVYCFVSVRSKNSYNIDGSVKEYAIDLIDTLGTNTPSKGEMIWVDDNGSNKWQTMIYSPSYEIANEIHSIDDVLGYGHSVALSIDDTKMAIADYSGDVTVYTRVAVSLPWERYQKLKVSLVNYNLDENVGRFSTVTRISPLGNWIAIGSPYVSNVSSKYLGEYDSTTTYTDGFIVKYNNHFYTTSASSSFESWQETTYPEVDLTGDNMMFTEQGIVTIYSEETYVKYRKLAALVSPSAQDNELFGSSVVFGNDELFIGARGSNTVYRFVYTDITKASAKYTISGSSGLTIKLSSVIDIEAGMYLHNGNAFTNKQVVTMVDAVNKTVTISSPPNATPNGIITFSIKQWMYDLDKTITVSDLPVNSFGKHISISKDYSVLVISAEKEVYIYTLYNGDYSITQILTEKNASKNYGISTSLSSDGNYLIVSDNTADGEKLDQGKVYVYKRGEYGYELYKTLRNNKPEVSQHFGTAVEFVNDYKHILVYGDNSDTILKTTFDNNTTVFDNESTTATIIRRNSGRIDIYNLQLDNWCYSESLEFDNSYNTNYANSISVGHRSVLVGAPTSISKRIKTGMAYEYRTAGQNTWSVKHHEIDKPDVLKVKQAFLYDKVSNELIKYIDVIDPSQGKIPGIADQELSYKMFYDPAVYTTNATAGTFIIGRTYTIETVGTTDFTAIGAAHNTIGTTFVATDIGDGTGTAVDIETKVDPGLSWGKNQVGNLWWDLRSAKFVDSYDNDVVYRNSVWNTLAVGASIDVYEWVESHLLPSEWDAITETDAGVADGISGKTLYGNTAYCVIRHYDTLSRTYDNTYYFWVKDKKITPETSNRNMSGYNVARLIGNPRGVGYEYLSLTGNNSFSLTNIKSLLKTSNVVLSVEYWTIGKIDQNVHTQWQLISADSATTIPVNIETKWFDSLCGVDSQDRTVPDISVPLKLRYGIENRPRQSMFVNRIEALKQVIEQANVVLKKTLISDTRDLTGLYAADNEPHIIRGMYDVIKDTIEELEFTGYGNFIAASLTPIITNGHISGVTIVTPGKGYVNAPFIHIVGSGENAIVKSVINSKGEVVGIDIINSGNGYDESTSMFIRDYSVLIHNDSTTNGKWAIYSYSPDASVWSRVYTQTYNTRKYWDFVDWYSEGFNEFAVLDHSVGSVIELPSLEVKLGGLVKVRNINSGYWAILRKKSNDISYDWTLQYDIIAAQNGTIQISSSLYDYKNTSYGYDGSPFDGAIFDNAASSEIRYILSALKHDIFIGTMKSDYLNLFFTSVRYALNEQLYLDWIFKTSFVKVTHNVGELHNRVNYQNDNLPNFEDYVAEVKPYRTQIREYVSVYDKVEETAMMVSDFDLPPIFKNNVITPIYARLDNGALDGDTDVLTKYPWKNWADNHGYQVASLILVDQGTEYLTDPVIKFTSNSGSGAEARAIVSNGKVVRIVLTKHGSGYLTPPTVEIVGGKRVAGETAKVVAIIGNGVVRSTLIQMKFDRISKTRYLTQLEEVETFTGNGSIVQFPLIWSPDNRTITSTVTVTVNGTTKDVLREDYTLKRVKSTSRGYTSYFGMIAFKSAPAANSKIIVSYLKDWSVLTAADRIAYYYNPTTGDLGNELSQILTGIDYGGVNVTGLGFESSGGWGKSAYSNDRWGSGDITFDDYVVTVPAQTSVLTLPYVPEDGTELNIYYTKVATSYPSLMNNSTTNYQLYTSAPYPSVSVKLQNVKQSLLSNAGSYTIYLDNIDNIKVGDAVSIASEVVNGKTINKLMHDSVVVDLFDSLTGRCGVKLNNIIYYGDILANIDIVFSRPFVNNTDYTITVDGKKGMVLKLNAAIPNTSRIEVTGTFEEVRIDGFRLVMDTPIITNPPADNIVIGTSNVQITLPEDFAQTVGNGSIFTIRRHTSDGSMAAPIENFDTSISGGDFAYSYVKDAFSSATGLTAEDIIIDGDSLTTPNTSAAPEEVVPGQVNDTLAIKVYEYTTNGSAAMRVDNHIADGNTTVFGISQDLNSSQSVLVKVGDILQETTAYTVDYAARTVTFTDAPDNKKIVSIFSTGVSGNNVLGIGKIIADGINTEYVTDAEYIEPISFIVYVNGRPVNAMKYKTTIADPLANMVGIRLTAPPLEGDVITYMIVNSDTPTFAVTSIEKIQNPSETNYLTSYIGDSSPLETNNIVIGKDVTGLKMLHGPSNVYFDIVKNQLRYEIDITKYATNSLSNADVLVFADGKQLILVDEYIFEPANNLVTLTKSVAAYYAGKRLLVSVIKDNDYFIRKQTAHSAAILTITNGATYEYIELVSSYNNTSVSIEATMNTIDTSIPLDTDSIEYFQFKNLTGGMVTLPRSVLNESYVWVTVNGKLLTPSVDFKLNDDKNTITLTKSLKNKDVILITTYGSNIMKPVISYMQFKDMLNRTHYKRLNADKRTKLVNDLHINDLIITVEDSSNFDIPVPSMNIPGVIEIRGERIEYFGLSGNVLSKLRRATLGTGAVNVHLAGSYVQCIGASETIPYKDTVITKQVVSDGTDIIPIDIVPRKSDTVRKYSTGFISKIPSKYGSTDEIEVFVGGHDDSVVWQPNQLYSKNDIVMVNSYTYKCVKTHTSGEKFKADYSKWTLFIGNIRLRKDPYKVHDVNIHPESKEGDVQLDADFSVDGVSPHILLTNPVSAGTIVTVVKTLGNSWDVSASLMEENTAPVNFIKDVPGSGYSSMR